MEHLGWLINDKGAFPISDIKRIEFRDPDINGCWICLISKQKNECGEDLELNIGFGKDIDSCKEQVREWFNMQEKCPF